MNYFNYFTEVEEHFQRARNSRTFLLSPLDWALVEAWKDSGVPLEAVHKGIDRTFEKRRARKRRTRMINSLAYCSQEVLTAAREMAEPAAASAKPPAAVFEAAELARYFESNAKLVRRARAGKPSVSGGETFRQVRDETADSLEQLASAVRGGGLDDLESVEDRLTTLEERLLDAAEQSLGEDQIARRRGEIDLRLAPYRGKMPPDQLALLEKQFLARWAFEAAGLPRLSLFYWK